MSHDVIADVIAADIALVRDGECVGEHDLACCDCGFVNECTAERKEDWERVNAEFWTSERRD